MSAYAAPALPLVGLLVLQAALVLLVPRLRVVPAVAWPLGGAAVVAAIALSTDAPAGTRMLVLCAAIFLSMKGIVLAATRRAGRPVPSGALLVAFTLLWVGMRPWAFVQRRARADVVVWRTVRSGVVHLALGVGLVLLARALDAPDAWGTQALATLGAILMAHFGGLALLAAFWMARGHPVGVVCDAPDRARSLGEFWGRRWNLPFAEMMQIAVRRPLAGRAPRWLPPLLVFVLSGLLHDLVLSLPARAGFGLPLAWFALHGGLVALEPRLGVPRWPAVWARTWTLGWILVPAPLLFHPPFLDACVRPLLAGASGG